MNQPKAIPHPNDADKWMSSFDSYGHGPGNGKSRNAIYKRFKKVHGPDSVKSTPSKKEATESLKNKSDFNDKSTTFEQARSTAVLENVEKSLQEPEESPESGESDDGPDSEMAQGQRMAFNQESQAQMIRVGFRALDRALTHYGRGVMNSKDWSVDRSESDYDALEGATSAVFEHYGVQVPVSPLLVLGVTLSTAYLPPLNHIRKNADPNRKGGRILGVFRRLIPKRFRKAKPVRGEPDEPILE